MFYAVAAAVIGGTALAGGSGTVIGAFLGTLVLAILADGFNLTGISANPLPIILGGAILVAMIANVQLSRLRGREHADEHRHRRPPPRPCRPARRQPTMTAAGRAHLQAVRRGDRARRRQPAPGQGEVLGLIGDNGAGKSTLLKILCGFQPPDSGRILLNGEEVTLKSVDHARSLGIDAVYQDLALINELTVYHNMFLNRETVRWPLLNNRAMRKLARQHLDDMGVGIPSVDVEVARLSGGQRQAIAVARAVYSDAKILLLDEPLAAMGAKEAALILDLVQDLKRRGDVSVIIIAHNYGQVLEVATGSTCCSTARSPWTSQAGDLGPGAERHRHRRVPPRPGGAPPRSRLTAGPYTGTNSMPASWQNTRQSAAWWPRFITSWCGPPAASQPFRQCAQPGGRAELAVGHLQRRQLRAVQVLPLGHHQPEPLALQVTSVASVAGPGWYWNRNVGGSASRPMPSGRLISRTGRSERAIFQLPSPMWLISTESDGKSIAYISVKCASPISMCPAATRQAVSTSPSAA